jgi:hypothetical protein
MQNIFGQIALPSMRGVLNSKVPTTMYSGGKGLGTAQQGVIQNNCPPEQIQTIYYGGNGYGNQQEIIVQNICVAPPIETIFYGGIGYGSQQQNMIQGVCVSPPIESIFYGGPGYGSQQQTLIQGVCRTINSPKAPFEWQLQNPEKDFNTFVFNAISLTIKGVLVIP